MRPRLPSWMRSRKSTLELAYLRALEMTSRRLAATNRAFARSPARTARRSRASSVASAASPSFSRASSPASMVCASSTSSSAVSSSCWPIWWRYWATRSVVSRPRSSSGAMSVRREARTMDSDQGRVRPGRGGAIPLLPHEGKPRRRENANSGPRETRAGPVRRRRSRRSGRSGPVPIRTGRRCRCEPRPGWTGCRRRRCGRSGGRRRRRPA